MESSVKISQLGRKNLSFSEDQKTNDLAFIQFDKEKQEYLLFLLKRRTKRTKTRCA